MVVVVGVVDLDNQAVLSSFMVEWVSWLKGIVAIVAVVV